MKRRTLKSQWRTCSATFQTFFGEVQRAGRGEPVLQEYADNLMASAQAAGISRTEEVSLERAIKASMDGRISGKSADRCADLWLRG